MKMFRSSTSLFWKITQTMAIPFAWAVVSIITMILVALDAWLDTTERAFNSLKEIWE